MRSLGMVCGVVCGLSVGNSVVILWVYLVEIFSVDTVGVYAHTYARFFRSFTHRLCLIITDVVLSLYSFSTYPITSVFKENKFIVYRTAKPERCLV